MQSTLYKMQSTSLSNKKKERKKKHQQDHIVQKICLHGYMFPPIHAMLFDITKLTSKLRNKITLPKTEHRPQKPIPLPSGNHRLSIQLKQTISISITTKTRRYTYITFDFSETQITVDFFNSRYYFIELHNNQKYIYASTNQKKKKREMDKEAYTENREKKKHKAYCWAYCNGDGEGEGLKSEKGLIQYRSKEELRKWRWPKWMKTMNWTRIWSAQIQIICFVYLLV